MTSLEALERVLYFQAQLRDGVPTTANALAAHWGVSRSTVCRHIQYMERQLKMPIAWDPARHTYFFTAPCDTIPWVVLDSRDALTLALVGRVCEVFYGSSFAGRLDVILKRLAPMLGGAMSSALEALDQVIVPPQPDAFDEFEHFFPLFDAIRERREVRLLYTPSEQDDPAERVVQPLALARRRSDNRWLLVAYDPRLAELRKFLLIRLQEFTATEQTFAPPAGVNVQEYIRKSLDAFAGDEEHEVRVALDRRAAFYACEQPWHPSQRLKDLPDGRVELTIRVNDLPGARNLVLRWGAHVEVLSPPALRDEVRTELQAALTKYSGR